MKKAIIFLIKILLTGLLSAGFCFADISGIVTDTGSTPLSGAVVQLENNGQTAQTGADGLFTLISTAILTDENKQPPTHTLSATIHNGLLCVKVAKKTAVEVTTFDLAGKALSIVRKTLDAGTNSITLPFRGAGIYLYKVKSGNREVVLKGNSVSGISFGSGVLYRGSSSNKVVKQANAEAAVTYVIAAAKTGYLNYRVGVYNADTTGLQIKMITSAGTVTDADGNVYQTVKIGDQEWTVENLRTTKYRDGSPIPFDTLKATWERDTTPKFCYYDNTTVAVYIKVFGALYNWYVVDMANAKKIAPSGWHVPSDAEWDTLENFLKANGYDWNGTTTDNKIAKAISARTGWRTAMKAGKVGTDLSSNNSSGFSAFPGGFRSDAGKFSEQSTYGFWWSATECYGQSGYGRDLYYDSYYLKRNEMHKSCGLSVRLLRD